MPWLKPAPKQNGCTFPANKSGSHLAKCYQSDGFQSPEFPLTGGQAALAPKAITVRCKSTSAVHMLSTVLGNDILNIH